MIIIHHNDPDGWCAAAIAARHHHFSRQGKPEPVEFIEADYSKQKDAEWMGRLRSRIAAHDGPLVIVDFSFAPGVMQDLCDLAGGQFIWIDHHASCKDYPQHFSGLRDFADKSSAACELAWQYFLPDVPLPLVVELIADYDAWKMKRRDECMALIVAVNAAQPQPGDIFWNSLLDFPNGPANIAENARRLVDEGRVMMRYRDGYCDGLCKSIGFETEFHGMKCYALNAARMGSAMFGTRFNQYDACLSFYFDGTRFTVSVYSERPQVDCAAICMEHGGGGHKGASGFTCDTLPFKKAKIL